MHLHFAASRLKFVYIAVLLPLSGLSLAQMAPKKERLFRGWIAITKFAAHQPRKSVRSY
jgi:hypothetical protein